MPVVVGGDPVFTLSSTLSDLIEETRRHLLSYRREPMNKLNADVGEGATSLTFQYDLKDIKAGCYVQIGLELFHVWEVNETAKSAVVEPAQLGSISGVHDQGDLVTVNPRFPNFAIARAINEELAVLSSPTSGLFAVRYLDLEPNPQSLGYDLAAASSIIDVMEVRQRSHSSNEKLWPLVPAFEFSRSVNAADFPSGYALFLRGGSHANQPIRVTYKAGFTPLTALTDDVTAVSGLPLSAHDIPPIGAAVRLAAPREIKRNFTESQGDTRRADEVPPGSVSNSVRVLMGQRMQRIKEEAATLSQQYPPRDRMHYGMGAAWSRW